MAQLWSRLVSLRTTAALLVAFSALLLVNVIVPQAQMDPEGFARAIRSGPVFRFVLDVVGFGHVATSVPFVAILVAFFANLAAVLVDRIGATIRRVRFVPPTPAEAAGHLAAPGALEISAADGSVERAADLLRRMGYRTAGAGEATVWGVKHRLAPLGFPLFHASFFLILAGGLLLYLTRDVVTLLVTEGQTTPSSAGEAHALVRRSPLGPPGDVRVRLDRVDVKLEHAKPVDLAATLVLDGAEPVIARINHPVERGPLTVLVERAGIAPVLWLVDARGYTLDRVLVPVASPLGLATRLSLGDGDIEVAIEAIPVGADFPERSALASVPVPLRVRVAGKKAFEGALRPGEAAELGDRSLRVQEVKYWAGLRLVSERGGGLLVAGFAMSVLGIVWRTALTRREIVVGRVAGVVRIAGRGELLSDRVVEEMELVRDLLARPVASESVETRRPG